MNTEPPPQFMLEMIKALADQVDGMTDARQRPDTDLGELLRLADKIVSTFATRDLTHPFNWEADFG